MTEVPTESAIRMRKYRKEHPEYYYKGLIRNRMVRLELMDLLGGRVCSECGFKDVRALHIDHVEAGGTQERKAFKSTTKMWYYYYRNPEIAKKKLRVVCANCNQIKQHTGLEYSWKDRPRTDEGEC